MKILLDSIFFFKSLSSTVAFGLGCDYIARFEGMVVGIQWSNINKGAQPNDNFTFLNCIIMMLIDSVIYMLLTIYIENVFPGKERKTSNQSNLDWFFFD